MTTQTTPQAGELESLQHRAAAGIDEAETCELGAPFDAVDAAALDGVTQLRTTAAAVLFPAAVAPIDANVLAVFSLARETWTLADLVGEIANLHRLALPTWPALAAFLRQPITRRLVSETARAFAGRTLTPPDAAAAAWLEHLEATIAEQLRDDPVLGAAARAYLAACALQDRLGIVRARHLAHAAAEVARVEAERQAAAEAVARAERDRRDGIAEFFGARSSFRFVFRGRAFSGTALANLARQHAAYGDDGTQWTEAVDLDELDLVMRRAQAAEAVTA